MPQPRRELVHPLHAASYHCVTRCVRRGWLCGIDDYLGKSFEHRKAWVADRILEVGSIFACGIYGYAVMSNHFHLVVHMSPSAAAAWSDEEIATRWVRLFPTGSEKNDQRKIDDILIAPDRIATYRTRLSDLSWLMKSINEPIARRANAEDEVKGHFWEARFKCQLLQREADFLSAMTYVDLNPVRAKMAQGVSTSKHTSVQARFQAIRNDPQEAHKPLLPIVGVQSFNLNITVADYIELVDFTGRQCAANKRDQIDSKEPKALTRLGLSADHWTVKVQGVGSGYWRIVACLEDLRAKATEMGKRVMFGVGLAMFLERI